MAEEEVAAVIDFALLLATVVFAMRMTEWMHFRGVFFLLCWLVAYTSLYGLYLLASKALRWPAVQKPTFILMLGWIFAALF